MSAFYEITLMVNEEGFWLAKLPGYKLRAYGDVCATPGEAVTSLLAQNGVKVNTGARVVLDDEGVSDDYTEPNH